MKIKRIKKINKKAEEVKLSALDHARIRKQEMKDQGIEVKQRNPQEVWEDGGKNSLRKSINAHCFDCCGGENYRARIKFCTSPQCNLWNIRPYSKGITHEQCLNYKEA